MVIDEAEENCFPRLLILINIHGEKKRERETERGREIYDYI